MKQPLVSVLIVNWNGGRVFEECLESLKKIDYPNWELVAVDNGSTDGSIEKIGNYIKKSKTILKLVQNDDNVGFAEGNNQAWGRARGKYILLLNNDTKVPKNLITILVERMEREPGLGVVQPKILMMDKKGYLDNAGSFMTRIGFLEHWGFGQKDGKEFEKEREIFSAKGACMMIRREVIETVGLFDDDFVSYFEESDFCWRAWLAGWRVLFYPKVAIEHKVGFTIKKLDVANINYHYYKNRICALIKNFGGVNLVRVVPVHLVISIGIAGLFVLRMKPKSALIILKAMRWNVWHLSGTLRKRKEVQRLRKVSDEELFGRLMHPVKWRKFWGDFRRVEEDIKKKN